MRPKLLFLCVLSSLLAATIGRAVAQSGAYNAAGSAPSAVGHAAENPTLPSASPLPVISSGRSPTGRLSPAVTAPASSLREEPWRNDQSWTHSTQLDSSSGHIAAALQGSAATQNSAVPLSAAASVGTTVAATAVRPVRGQSDSNSYVSQAQFTSPEPQAATASHPSSSGPSDNATKEPRALKRRSSPDSAPESKRSSGTVQMFISVVSSLLIVIGLLLGAAWCYRKASPGSTGSLPKQVIQVLGRSPLAPRQQLILLRFGSKLLLVSNLQGEVRTISEIVDPLEVDRVTGLCESAQAGSISDSFRSVLHNIGRTG